MSSLAVRQFCSKALNMASQLPAPARPSNWLADSSREHQLQCAYLIIDLLDLWGKFCRTIVLDLATGRAKDLSGNQIINPSPMSESAALSAICNRRGHEPKWYNARECIQALSILRPPFSANITAAIGVSTSPIPDLLLARNYFAHRRTDCRDKLLSAGFYDADMNLCPYKIANFLLPNSKSIFLTWVDDLQIMALSCVR